MTESAETKYLQGQRVVFWPGHDGKTCAKCSQEMKPAYTNSSDPATLLGWKCLTPNCGGWRSVRRQQIT